MKKTNEGISAIDLLVILILFTICLAGIIWVVKEHGLDKALVYYGSITILTFCILVPVWIRNDRKDRLSSKELYEKGMIEKEHYKNLVGEKFFRKHHGNDPD